MTRSRKDEQLARLEKHSGRTLEDVSELFEERAAIRQFEGGAKPSDAERYALDDVACEVLR